MTREIKREYYQVSQPCGHYGLVERFETLDAAIKGGIEMNERERSGGYKETDWIVSKVSVTRLMDGDDFLYESIQTSKMYRKGDPYCLAE